MNISENWEIQLKYSQKKKKGKENVIGKLFQTSKVEKKVCYLIFSINREVNF